MNDKEKVIVNEAIAIIAGECKKNKYCEECVFFCEETESCSLFFDYDETFPMDLERPFKTKKQRHWLSGKEVEVLDNG